MNLVPVKITATVDHMGVGDHVELPEDQANNLMSLGLAVLAEPLGSDENAGTSDETAESDADPAPIADETAASVTGESQTGAETEPPVEPRATTKVPD